LKKLSAKLAETQQKALCQKCLPKNFPLEAGCQATTTSADAQVQAPDNDSLFDPVEGYSTESAITEVNFLQHVSIFEIINNLIYL
jgi:hypothetical protein